MRKTLALAAVFFGLVGAPAMAGTNGLGSATSDFSLPSISLNMGGVDSANGSQRSW